MTEVVSPHPASRRLLPASRLLLLVGIWVVVMVVSLGLGAVRLSFGDVLRLLAARLPGLRNAVSLEGIEESAEVILFQVRMPRVFLAGIVGASLALSGATLQGIFRNPMADPFVLGVASGASLGAVCAFFFGAHIEGSGLGAVPIFAFAGAVGTTAFVYLLAHRRRRVSVATLLLTGIALGSLLSALTSLTLVFRERELNNVLFWLLGSLSRADWRRVEAVTPYFVLGLGTVLYYSRDLNALILGEEQAHSLGVEVERVKRRLLLATSLLTAAAVSVSGVIGFVGLLVPHIVRLLVGADHRWLIPTAALAGAIFLTGVDTLARTVLAPTEIPVGAVTALFGAPFFLFLLRSK